MNHPDPDLLPVADLETLGSTLRTEAAHHRGDLPSLLHRAQMRRVRSRAMVGVAVVLTVAAAGTLRTTGGRTAVRIGGAHPSTSTTPPVSVAVPTSTPSSIRTPSSAVAPSKPANLTTPTTNASSTPLPSPASPTVTAQSAAKCLLGAYLYNNLRLATVCAGSASRAQNLFGSLSGFDREVLGKYAAKFEGCEPAPAARYVSHIYPAGTRIYCKFGDDLYYSGSIGVWIVVSASGPPYYVVDIAPY